MLYWPIISILLTTPRCVIFKTPFSTSYASRPGSTQPETHCESLVPAGCPVTHWRSLQLTKSYLVARWDWQIKIQTSRISHGHWHISFHNTHIFPFNHVTASAYFSTGASSAENLWLTVRPRVLYATLVERVMPL